MKRIVVGTFNQCIKVLKKNKKLKEAGYHTVEMHPLTTKEEYDKYITSNIGVGYNSIHPNNICYSTKCYYGKYYKVPFNYLKTSIKKELYILTLER